MSLAPLGPQSRPVYESLRAEILAGVYPTGLRLPAQQSLAERFGVAVMTVRGALTRLEWEGLVRCEQGRGTFVGDPNAVLNQASGSPPATVRPEHLEHRLAESDRYRAIFESAHVGLNATDQRGRYVAANSRFLALVGYCEEELLGKHFTEITHPDDAERDCDLYRNVASGEIPGYEIDKRYVRKDGTEIWVRLTVGTEEHDGQKLRIASVLDITDERRAVAALRDSEARLRSIFDRAPIGMAIADMDGRFVQTNRALQVMLGYREDELCGMHWTEIAHPEDVAREDELDELLISGQIEQYELDSRHIRKDGTTIWTRSTVSEVWNDQGEPIFAIAMLEDITERKRAEEELRASEARFHGAFRHANVGMALVGLDGRYLQVNQAFCNMLGYTPEQLSAMTYLDITHPDDLELSREAFERDTPVDSLEQLQKRYIHADGHTVWIELNSSLVRDADGHILYHISHFLDVTERKQSEEALAHQALHDALTDLPNRVLLRDRLEQAILAAQRESSPLALMFLDLDRFKDVNDTFGHHVGDALLQELARRLRDAIRASDTVARLGGDEFAVLLPATDTLGAELVAQKIQEALADPCIAEDHVFDVGASIGISLYPDHGTDASSLMRHADVAMYAAKRSDVPMTVYCSDHDATDPERLELVRQLRSAIEQGRISLHYQPQIHLQHGCADHAEALARWNHPQRGAIPPATFIPLAEEHGLMKPLTLWVLRAALHQAADWRDRGLDMRVAVNLSARILHDPTIVPTVSRLLTSTGAKPESLLLEITESAIIVDPERALATLDGLHRMGVQIAIDDFGTGYSSFAHLQRLPIDEIKVDRSFVRDMVANPDDHFIVRSIVELAHNLGIRVVAEGVEDDATLAALERLGCDLAQGYRFTPPLPADRLERWLRNHLDSTACA